jgi:O-acetyl-ADP-ribose deacetylase (regulator of RNase III)
MTLPIEIEIWQGEIAELEVDAVVIPANESLFMTAPVAAAVKRYAGDEVETEAVAQGPVPAGSAVVTSGGRLAAPYVIHAVGVGHDLRHDPEQLRRAIDAALDAADHLSLRRIAVGTIGVERGVFTPAEAAEILLEAIVDRAEAGSETPESVVVAVTHSQELSDYLAALETVATRAAALPPAESA